MELIAARHRRGFVENEDSIFQADGLAGWEYREQSRRNRFLEPEKKLMLAVLVDAVACFRKYLASKKRRERILFQEAEDWLLDQDSDGLFSFGQICETIGIDPHYLRRELMAWKFDRLRAARLAAAGNVRCPNAARNKVQYFSLPGHGRG